MTTVRDHLEAIDEDAKRLIEAASDQLVASHSIVDAIGDLRTQVQNSLFRSQDITEQRLSQLTSQLEELRIGLAQRLEMLHSELRIGNRKLDKK